jgi:hypothetical protein
MKTRSDLKKIKKEAKEDLRQQVHYESVMEDNRRLDALWAQEDARLRESGFYEDDNEWENDSSDGLDVDSVQDEPLDFLKQSLDDMESVVLYATDLTDEQRQDLLDAIAQVREAEGFDKVRQFSNLEEKINNLPKETNSYSTLKTIAICVAVLAVAAFVGLFIAASVMSGGLLPLSIGTLAVMGALAMQGLTVVAGVGTALATTALAGLIANAVPLITAAASIAAATFMAAGSYMLEEQTRDLEVSVEAANEIQYDNDFDTEFDEDDTFDIDFNDVNPEEDEDLLRQLDDLMQESSSSNEEADDDEDLDANASEERRLER